MTTYVKTVFPEPAVEGKHAEVENLNHYWRCPWSQKSEPESTPHESRQFLYSGASRSQVPESEDIFFPRDCACFSPQSESSKCKRSRRWSISSRHLVTTCSSRSAWWASRSACSTSFLRIMCRSSRLATIASKSPSNQRDKTTMVGKSRITN